MGGRAAWAKAWRQVSLARVGGLGWLLSKFLFFPKTPPLHLYKGANNSGGHSGLPVRASRRQCPTGANPGQPGWRGQHRQLVSPKCQGGRSAEAQGHFLKGRHLSRSSQRLEHKQDLSRETGGRAWGQHPQRFLPGRRWGQAGCGGSQQFDNLESEAEAGVVSDELRDGRDQILEGPVCRALTGAAAGA